MPTVAPVWCGAAAQPDALHGKTRSTNSTRAPHSAESRVRYAVNLIISRSGSMLLLDLTEKSEVK